MEAKTLILTAKQMQQKIVRIAHQIHENHYDAEKLVVLGLEDRGFVLAEKIVTILKEISTLPITLSSVVMDKNDPLSQEIKLGVSEDQLKDAVVIVVDDVLNSGRTLIHAVTKVIQSSIKLVRTVTMVDRRHRKFPIKADYVGLTLATTLQEHIHVNFDEEDTGVYLA